MLKRPAILFTGLLIAAVFVVGLVRLFDLRLDQGDSYPPYSTLRTDPLGASVFYEGLDRVPGVTVQRYFEETFKKEDGNEHALFVLGLEPWSFDELSRSEYDTLQRFIHNGGRVVIAYHPEANGNRAAGTNDTDNADAEGRRFRRSSHKKSVSETDAGGDGTSLTNKANSLSNTNVAGATNETGVANQKRTKPRHDRNSRRAEPPPDDQDDSDLKNELKAERLKYVNLAKEWGFEFKFANLATNADGELQFPQASLVAGQPELPAHLPVHTTLCFTNLTNSWATIYQRDKKSPVIIERKIGAGSVVLVADAYPFSNEAMFKDRSAPLLAWAVGSGRDAIFDEAHLGLVEQPGMATLMRRYRLHGLIFSLLVVAGLFVWKNSLSLVPPHEKAGGAAGLVVAGHDSAAGFVKLVRRGIAPSEIISVCFAEWRKSGARAAAVTPDQRREVEQLIRQQEALVPKERKPVTTYRNISQILKRRKRSIYESKSSTT